MKKILEALRKKLSELKLADGLIKQLTETFESTAKKLGDDEAAMKALAEQLANAGAQLAEAGAPGDSVINIQLGEINTAGAADLDTAVAKKLEEIQAQQLKEQQDAEKKLGDLQKVFDDAIDAVEGFSDDTAKQLKEAKDLITAGMTEDQVKKLAETQINLGHQLESARKLSGMGYQVSGSPQIQHGHDNSSMQLQEEINKGLKQTAAAVRLALAEEDKLHPFVAQALAVFDAQHARQLHEEAKQLANGEVNIASTNLPVGFQRTVIREALSDLRVLELVNAMTDPTATATTQIPYETRDTSQIVNDGIVYEGQGIPPAGITQSMDTAYIVPMKISLKVSNEVMHFSVASGIDWNAYARNVESNARVMRELIVRRICNELQRSADAYLSVDVSAEAFDSQMGKASGIIKTANFPILRPHQDRDLQGTAVGSLQNGITVVLNGANLVAFDGTGTQGAGTYYRVSNYNLGYIQVCDQTGAAVALPADIGANTVDYSYATNITKFDLDVPGTTTLERHLNGLLQAIGARKATLADDRFVTPDFQLMSHTMNENCTNAENFTSAAKRDDVSVSAQGDLVSVKGIGAWRTNAPGVDLGDDRILMGQRGTLAYTIAKAFATGTPFEAVDGSGRPTGEKVAYGEEYSAIKVPTPIRNRLTSVIAYSVTGRAAV